MGKWEEMGKKTEEKRTSGMVITFVFLSKMSFIQSLCPPHPLSLSWMCVTRVNSVVPQAVDHYDEITLWQSLVDNPSQNLETQGAGETLQQCWEEASVLKDKYTEGQWRRRPRPQIKSSNTPWGCDFKMGDRSFTCNSGNEVARLEWDKPCWLISESPVGRSHLSSDLDPPTSDTSEGLQKSSATKSPITNLKIQWARIWYSSYSLQF